MARHELELVLAHISGVCGCSVGIARPDVFESRIERMEAFEMAPLAGADFRSKGGGKKPDV